MDSDWTILPPVFFHLLLGETQQGFPDFFVREMRQQLFFLEQVTVSSTLKQK